MAIKLCNALMETLGAQQASAPLKCSIVRIPNSNLFQRRAEGHTRQPIGIEHTAVIGCS